MSTWPVYVVFYTSFNRFSSILNSLSFNQVSKMTEKAVCRSVLTLYFESRINKNALLQIVL